MFFRFGRIGDRRTAAVAHGRKKSRQSLPRSVIDVTQRKVDAFLAESDGPMLVVGLQQIHGQQIHLPRRTIDLPDRTRLERRYEQFRQAAG